MANHNTVFAQLLKFVPRHEFESLANQHHSGRKLRKMTRWNQFVSMAAAQLSGRNSLRDVVSNRASAGSATTKGVVKLHVGLDHEGLLPAFVAITDGKTHDITTARAVSLPKGTQGQYRCHGSWLQR